MQIAVVGAGFSGAVVAHELARAGCFVRVFEAREHVAGNCHTVRDPDTGVMIHRYGPHIFHTADKRAWDYIRQFDEMVPYINRVKAVAKGQVYSFPINLLTIGQFFGGVYSPAEARKLVEQHTDQSIESPGSFEEQALKTVGRPLYEAFLRGYTLKQWGVHPRELPASILTRLPVRFNYDDNYYNHPFQGIPRNGYTYVITKMLDHPHIEVVLNHQFGSEERRQYDHCFWTGSIDSFFRYKYGRLPYRTLDFEVIRTSGDFQGTAVINYCDEDVPYTRITEHKHFAPWENHARTICYREYSRACEVDDIPYYPIRFIERNDLLKAYNVETGSVGNVTFIGRLGTYRYLDMDQAIIEALSCVGEFLEEALF